jgi:Flp pilus assembly CpaF family ATPase
VRSHLTRSIDVVVHVERGPGGTRRIGEVVEVVESDGPPRVRSLTTATTVIAHLGRRRDGGRR